MTTDYKIEADGTITITTKFKPEGSMLEQEEQIAAALAAAGRLATQLTFNGFDTEGQSLIVYSGRFDPLVPI